MDIHLSDINVRISPSGKELFKISDFKIKFKDQILIKGESGKGKTTLLHLLAGLFIPHQGKITIGDTDLTQLSDEERTLFRKNHLGIVFQKLNLIEYFTALENVELSGRADALKALSSVGLEAKANERASVMSLGEQQRIAVARVLAGAGQIVLADEPTSSLDEKNAQVVTQLLLEACKDKTLIVVSHDHRIEKYFSTILDFKDLIV